MKNFIKNVKNKKGTTLLLSLLILAVIFAIAIGVSNIILNQIKITGRVEESVLAFYAADTGIECKLYDIFILKSPESNSCSQFQSPRYLENKSTIVELNFSTSSIGSSIESIGQYILTRRGIKIEW